MSYFETIVHQTLVDNEDPDRIEAEGPYAASDIANSYLGSGYYFWDDHIELAHWWGEKHVKGDYVICEGELTVDKSLFFDLVGCRQDMIYFKDIISRMPQLRNLEIGKIIEILKEMSKNPNKSELFPFKVIRAVVKSKTSYTEEVVDFAKNKPGKMTLTPQIFICLVEKNKLHLQAFKVVYPSKYL
jgi:hypothetical protein